MVGGINLTLLQALGAGAPTLALDTPFNREVIGRGEQPYPRDPQELAGRIGAIMADRARQLDWARHGRVSVTSCFQWSDVSDAYEQALRDAVRKCPGQLSGGPTHHDAPRRMIRFGRYPRKNRPGREFCAGRFQCIHLRKSQARSVARTSVRGLLNGIMRATEPAT